VELASNQMSHLQEELDRMNISFNHEDYLIKRGVYYKNKIKELETSLINKELEQCTFKPETNPWKPVAQSNCHSRERSLVDRRGAPRRDRDKLEIEYEKQREQCTFRPNLDKSMRSPVVHQKKSSKGKAFKSYGKPVANPFTKENSKRQSPDRGGGIDQGRPAERKDSYAEQARLRRKRSSEKEASPRLFGSLMNKDSIKRAVY